MSATDSPHASIGARAAFDFVRYASVWEDADVLCRALAPVATDARLLSIASAGDNALALLTLDPREVVAVDLNPAQLACLELRIAAFRTLEDRELLEFLGFPPGADGMPGSAPHADATAHEAPGRSEDSGAAPADDARAHAGDAAPADDARAHAGGAAPADDPRVHAGDAEPSSALAEWRRDRYAARVRPALPESAAAFWDAHPEAIERGAIHAGKFERYFHRFRRAVLPLVHGRATVAALRAPRSIPEQEQFYRERWDTWRWRTLFRVFFSRFVMGRLGRDPEFFTHVDGPVATRILERTRHALTRIPTATNPYLAYILTGNFRRGALPLYARPEHRAAIRSRLDRVTRIAAPADAVAGPFAGFNLSDIFEYMSPVEHERTYAALLARAQPGARLVYWNMLAPRARPAVLAERVRPLETFARDLHLEDRAWFYQRLHVDEVVA